MMNKLKSWLTLIGIIIGLLGSGYGLYSKVRADRLKGERDNARDELTVKTTQVTRYKNELGQEVTKTIEYEKYVEDLQYSNDSLERKLYSTISASKVREKDLEEAYIVSIKTESTRGYDSIVNPSASIAIEDSVIAKVNSKPCDEIRYSNDGYNEIISYPDSVYHKNLEIISLTKSKRRVPRKMQLFKWAGWEWKKTIDRNMVEMHSNNPYSSLDGRMIKLNK